MENIYDESFDNGKYRVVLNGNYDMAAYRYNEEWRQLTGDNLIYNMLAEISRLRKIELRKTSIL